MSTFNEWWHFLIVVLSNLAFLIPIKKSWRTKYYEISIQLAIILISSSVYHVCDNRRNYINNNYRKPENQITSTETNGIFFSGSNLLKYKVYLLQQLNFLILHESLQIFYTE